MSSSGSGRTGAARAGPTAGPTVAPSSSCPLCYEAYNALGQDPLLVPRRLPCGDVACTGCLRASLDDASRALVCQSCLQSFVLGAGSVEAGLPAVAMAEPTIAAEEEEEERGNRPDVGDAGLGLATPTSSSFPDVSGSGSGSGSASRLADFMRNVPASAAGPHNNDGRQPLLSPSVTPRTLSAAEQAAHARAHQRLAEAKLSRLRFQRDGDQAKVDLQSSPGGPARDASAQELSSSGEAEAEGPWGPLDPDELVARFKVRWINA